MATFALVTTVGPQPRPARSTPGEPGRAADRQAFASLSYPTHRQVVRNPHVGRPGFLVSISIHPSPPFGVGDTRACFSYRIAKDGRHDPDIHSLRQCHAMLRPRALVCGTEREIRHDIEHQKAHQGCLFPCLDPPSSRTSRLFLCLLPRERTECIDRSDRLDPAPRFDGWIVAPVFVWPRPLSFINAMIYSL